MKQRALVMMVPLTPLRVGAGSSPTTLDIPLVKDNFDIPFIPASSFKGSLKAHLAIKDGCIIEDEERPKLECGKCETLCCLLGVNETETEHVGISKLSFSDLYPVLLPYPHPTELYVFLTSELALERVRFAITESLNEPIRVVEDAKVEIDGMDIKAKRATLSGTFLNILRDLNPLFDESVREVYIIDNELWSLIVNKSTIKETKNKINLYTGTVERGGLWNEEYLPHGTVIMGSIWVSGGENGYCRREFSSIEDALRALKLETRFSLFLGGRESVGRGLVEVKIIE